MDARAWYLREVYPRLRLPLEGRYPAVSLEDAAGSRPLGAQPLVMLVALTGTGKSTALDIARARAEGISAPRIPTRREVADWIAIPAAQAWAGEPLLPIADRVRRFHYTSRFAERVPGGMAAAFSWLRIAAAGHAPLLSEGIRGGREISFALRHFPHWRIIELSLPPLTRLRRLSQRREAFDRAQASRDLSFLPPSLRAEALSLLEAGEITPLALAIARAEAANYGLFPFADGAGFPQYQRLDIERSSPEQVAQAILDSITGAPPS